MDMYLVQYISADGNFFPSVRTYAEVISNARKMMEVGGRMTIYRLRPKRDPERMLLAQTKGILYLEDCYGNKIWE